MKMIDQMNEIEMMVGPKSHYLFHLYKKLVGFEMVVYDLLRLLRNLEEGLEFSHGLYRSSANTGKS